MAITDDAKATAALERIGYYRLSGYWFPMRHTALVLGPGDRPMIKALDAFVDGATFSTALDLYVFDKRLRLLFLDAIERVEVGLRVGVALMMGSRDPWAHRDPKRLDGRFARHQDPHTGKTKHDLWLERLDEITGRSKEDFVQHFRLNYSSPLPIWIAIESWDFGILSSFLSGMRYVDQEALCAKYGIPRPELLLSWARTINYLRNICAHHSRLWNKTLVDQPKPPKPGEIASLDHLAQDEFAQARPYAAAAILQFFLRTINPSSTWGLRLAAHMETFPKPPETAKGMAARHTGFPSGWSALPLWAPTSPLFTESP